MIVVVGHWELPAAWDNRRASKKALTLWTHTIKAFGVKTLRLVDGPGCHDSEINYKAVGSVYEALEEFPDFKVMKFEVGGQPPPKDITGDLILIFGSNYSGMTSDEEAYSLPTKTALHAEIACAVALDRITRWL